VSPSFLFLSVTLLMAAAQGLSAEAVNYALAVGLLVALDALAATDETRSWEGACARC
jgi:hypothetical protein